jgi:hypothetical protein
MSQIVRIHVNDELSFLVETEDEELNIEDPQGEEQSLSLPPGAVPTGAIRDKIEDLKHTVTSAVSCIREGFPSEIQPDELTLEFNIGLKGSIGIPVILTQSAGATFKIIAKWKGNEKK